MSNVYFVPVSRKADDRELSAAARRLLECLIEREAVKLEEKLPLKVHFGEQGNRSYLKPGTYDGIIDLFEERGVASEFTETSVLYGGERFERDRHVRLAQKHGFTRIPVTIADGARGEAATEITVGQKHFQHCSIAAGLAAAPQVLVVSHFKGHMLAGFGGALKQLSMGFASKGGKMAMHMNVKPRIRAWKCKRCGACLRRCQVGAIALEPRPRIDHSRCIGCGACFSICPHHAISILSWRGLVNALFGGRFFREKLAEYALAAHRGKRHLYLNFAVNITRGCDCEPHPMLNCCRNIGIFASLDPVAVDSACYAAVAAEGRKFRGREQLAYAEKIGVGSTDYTLIELPESSC